MLAGIPVKILNAYLYDWLLPQDLPGFFAGYPWAIAVGTLIYFGATMAVEGAYAFRWLRRKNYEIPAGRIWRGIFLANLASYAVVAPLHYYFTRPLSQTAHEFTRNAGWTSHPEAKVFFTAGAGEHLKSMRLDGLDPETIVPMAVKDYLLSTDLKLCLFRGTNGNLYLYRPMTGQGKLVLQSHERFGMKQAAFSPSGQYVAYANGDSNTLEAVNLQTGQHIAQPFIQKMDFNGASVVWSTNETTFYVGGLGKEGIVQCVIHPMDWRTNETLTQTPLAQSNAPDVLACYGRVGEGAWYGSDDWGSSFNADSCGGLSVYTEPGLGSHLGIYSGTNWQAKVEYLAVNPGLLHIARFYFGDVAFLDGGHECLFEANGYIYLLDIKNKRVGTVAQGGRFILLTPRYQKHL